MYSFFWGFLVLPSFWDILDTLWWRKSDKFGLPSVSPYTAPSPPTNPPPSKSFKNIRPSRLCTHNHFFRTKNSPTNHHQFPSTKKKKRNIQEKPGFGPSSNPTFSFSLLSEARAPHGAVVTWCLVPRLSKVDAHRHPLHFPSGSYETSPHGKVDGMKGVFEWNGWFQHALCGKNNMQNKKTQGPRKKNPCVTCFGHSTLEFISGLTSAVLDFFSDLQVPLPMSYSGPSVPRICLPDPNLSEDDRNHRRLLGINCYSRSPKPKEA